jgi:hypothetical protein
MAAIYSNGGNRWNILGFNFTKIDALSGLYKISVIPTHSVIIPCGSTRTKLTFGDSAAISEVKGSSSDDCAH